MKKNIRELDFHFYGLFRIWCSARNAEHSFPSHLHNAIEIEIPSNLSGFLYTPQGKIILRDNTAAIIPANLEHSTVSVPKGSKSSMVLLQINAQKIKKMVSLFGCQNYDRKIFWLLNGKRALLLPKENIKHEIEELLKFNSFGKKNNEPDENENIAVIFNIFSIINKIFKELDNVRNYKGYKKKIFDHRVNNIIEYLEKNFTSKVSLDQIAVQFKITKGYLCQIFKKETNQTIIDYLNKYRILKATHLFGEGHSNITRVCYDVGFEDLNYFIQLFKKETSFTPKKYSLMLKKN